MITDDRIRGKPIRTHTLGNRYTYTVDGVKVNVKHYYINIYYIYTCTQ